MAISVQKAKPGWHANVPGLTGLSIGLVFVGVGVYSFIMAATYEGALLSLLATGFGIVVIAITRDVVENRRYIWGRSGGGRFRPSSYEKWKYRAAEDKEDRKRASGEED